MEYEEQLQKSTLLKDEKNKLRIERREKKRLDINTLIIDQNEIKDQN